MVELKLNDMSLRLYPDGEIRADKKFVLTDEQRRAITTEQRRLFGKREKAIGFEFRAGFRIR